jgi:SNF2 family DNA or RNA helicase
MAKTKEEKRKIREKQKKAVRRKAAEAESKSQKSEFFYHEHRWFIDSRNYEKALECIKKAVRLSPGTEIYLRAMADLGEKMQRRDAMLLAMDKLYGMNKLSDAMFSSYVNALLKEDRIEDALDASEKLLARLPQMQVLRKKQILKQIQSIQQYCRYRLATDAEAGKAKKRRQPLNRPSAKSSVSEAPPENATAAAIPTPPKPAVPDVESTLTIDAPSFAQSLADSGQAASQELYGLVLEGQRIRFMDSFENLICLPFLKDVQSFWYQEETARKVLKTFRGRALLADEVGLGKTIEAGMVLKEYIQRKMVKSALILTPAPLVSQWQEELNAKFGIDFPSTDDPEFKNTDDFWNQPYVLASINQAKSSKNFKRVTEREYDLVIVDEAHHLKNRSTLNWKLVNELKKRFLLLLTATPVENNLMELYNLVTLLKPGQLKTATEFKREFMTKGDPTSPQNKMLLRDLLGQVMIRNTRALAKINIPPRFAYTLRVDPDRHEKELYDRVVELIVRINKANGAGNRLLLKNLLAEAGSSPRALESTLSKVFASRTLSSENQGDLEKILNLCRSIMGETGKNRTLLNLVEKHPGKKIIFVKYRGSLEQVSEFLSWRRISHALFHGSMDNAAKDAQIEAFRSEKDILVATEIGGEGRNLQFCATMVNYDLPWNPMKIEQRIGRIHRLGQEKQVTIYNLCNAGSLEDHILEILDRKINMFEMVIGEIDMIIGRIRGESEFEDIVYDLWVNTSDAAEREKGFAELGARLQRSKHQHEKTRELDKNLFGENYEL